MWVGGWEERKVGWVGGWEGEGKPQVKTRELPTDGPVLLIQLVTSLRSSFGGALPLFLKVGGL